MPLIPEVINDRKLWVIIGTREKNDPKNESEIVKARIEKLDEQWFKKCGFIWTGSFDDNKTTMTIFETTEEKAKNYFEQYSKVCDSSLDCKIYQWNALP